MMTARHVIGYPPRYHTSMRIDRRRESAVREPEARYSTGDLPAKITALLNRRSWPLFPDGCHLSSRQARELYRTVQGIAGLVHALRRSASASESGAQAFEEPQQSRLWNALIELSEGAMQLADEMSQR